MGDLPIEITFENFDKLDRKAFADRLTTVLTRFSPFYDEAFVLGLNAKFGAGKTTFSRMWKQQLKSENRTVIYINAWDTDFDNEPLVAIISALLKSLQTDSLSKTVIAALRSTLATTVFVGNDIIRGMTNIDTVEIIQSVKDEKDHADLEGMGRKLHENHVVKIEAYIKLREMLAKHVSSNNLAPIVILVDELDRVRPDYAVSFLEAIKHIFSVSGLCFVLAVDRSQLEASVRQLYGEIDFENYYLRFITREANLPETGTDHLGPLIASFYEKFCNPIARQELGLAISEKDQKQVLKFIEITSTAFRLSPRQIEHLVRCLAQITTVQDVNFKARQSWLKATVFLLAIMIVDPQLYQDLGRYNESAKNLMARIRDLLSGVSLGEYDERNLTYLVLSGLVRSGSQDELNEIADLLLEYDQSFDPEDSREDQRALAIQYLNGSMDPGSRPREQSPFQTIYHIIEQWREFL